MLKTTHRVRVEFGDTDPARIVYYPNYFRWFENSAWRLLWKAGLTLDVLREEFGLLGLPIVNANAGFEKPSRFADVLEVTSYVGRWSEKSFEIFHEVRNDGDVCARGSEVRVCAAVDDAGNMRALPVPAEIRRRLSVDD